MTFGEHQIRRSGRPAGWAPSPLPHRCPVHVSPALPVLPIRRVDASAVVPRAAAASRAGLGAVLRCARATRRLPVAARGASVQHALSPALPAPAALHQLVGALAGRLTVVNHPPAAALPRAAVALVRGLAWAALFGDDTAGTPLASAAGAFPPGDGRATRERALVRAWQARAAAPGLDLRWLARGGAPWVAAALYEEDAPTVRRVLAEDDVVAGGAQPFMPRFAVALRYHMVLFAGSGDAPGDAPVPAWDALDLAAARVIAPSAAVADEGGRPWFAGRLLVPDAWATARMRPEVRAEWAALTGRAGRADRYWYPDSWLRFLEPGRVVGCVSAAEVAQSRPGRLRGAGEPPRRGSVAPWEAGNSADAPYAATAPRLERGICVPPGYCLVDCAGTLDVAAVRV